MSSAPVYLITASGRGIGAAIARHLVGSGARVVLMSRSEASVALAKDLGGIGLQGSVTSRADLAHMVIAAQEAYGRIDGAVLNTGILRSSKRDDGSAHAAGPGYPPTQMPELIALEDRDWQDGFEIMVMNVIRAARIILPMMQAQGGGALVAISTFSAPEPRLDYPVASAMRASLSALIKLYADRYGRDGIRVNAVLPGFMENWDQPQEVLDHIPLNRLGGLEELAATVRFLLSSEAGYITGQNILVDGGINRGA